MLRDRIAGVLSVLVLAAGSWGQAPITPTTYVVGTCKPSFPSYPTISAALAATPAPSIVQVCPGTYGEQVVITQGVILQGIASGGLGQPIILPPSGGLSILATNLSLQPVAPMLWVNNAAGPVTINDITFDGINVGSPTAILAGIFVQNSSATINRVGIRNLKVVQPFADIGIYAEGGASNPVVTVQNSSIHDIRSFGIYGETALAGAGSVTMTLKGNYVSGASAGITLDSGSAGTVSNNTVSGGNIGINTNSGAAASISGNTIVASGFGIAVSDGSTVSGNKIFGTLNAGILIVGQTVAVQTNSITGGPVGIDYECGSDPNVNSNIINEVTTGLDNVGSGASGVNTYFNVGTIRSVGVCGPAAR